MKVHLLCHKSNKTMFQDRRGFLYQETPYSPETLIFFFTFVAQKTHLYRLTECWWPSFYLLVSWHHTGWYLTQVVSWTLFGLDSHFCNTPQIITRCTNRMQKCSMQKIVTNGLFQKSCCTLLQDQFERSKAVLEKKQKADEGEEIWNGFSPFTFDCTCYNKYQ